MSIGFVTNGELDPAIHWSTLAPPFRTAMEERGAVVLAPRPGRAGLRGLPRLAVEARRLDAVAWLQISARPEREVLAVAAGAKRRYAWVADAWPYSTPKILKAARLLRVDTLFVAFRESVEAMQAQQTAVRVEHLPFGCDTSVFRPREVERDIFAFSMGRRHEPIHEALEAYCAERGLTYVSSQGGRITDPQELGELVSRSRYFVVTTPDVDHPDRAGGISPFVMRYLEGLAGGARLLGTRPRSGELEDLGLGEGLLEIRADGTDLAERLDGDLGDVERTALHDRLAAFVAAEHSWGARAATLLERIAAR